MGAIFYIEDYQTIKSQSNNPEWKIDWPTNGQTILKCPNLKVEHGIFCAWQRSEHSIIKCHWCEFRWMRWCV